LKIFRRQVADGITLGVGDRDGNRDQIGVYANYLRFGIVRRFLLRRFLRALFGLLLFRLLRLLLLRLAIDSPLARRLSGRSHCEYEAGSDRKSSQRFQTPEISSPIHKSIRLLSLPSVNFRGGRTIWKQ